MGNQASLHELPYYPHVKELTVTTRPVNTVVEKTKLKQPRHLSVEAKNCLENMANGLDNEKLQRSLRRLASRHK